MALEELVVRLAETAVTDEVVRRNERLAPAASATWPKTMLQLESFNSCLLTYLSSPVCNWAICRLARLCRTNIIIEKSRVIENEFHGKFRTKKRRTWSHHKPKQMPVVIVYWYLTN
jgi:hypothetical protein